MTEDKEIKSAILIEFDAPNDVRFVPHWMGQVHPGQVIYACEMLITLAKQQILNASIEEQVRQQQNKQKIVTPKTQFIMPDQ